MIFRNEESTNFHNAGIQFPQQEVPTSELSHYQQSQGRVSFGLTIQHSVQDSHRDFQPGITGPGEPLSVRGISPPHSARAQLLGYPDSAYDSSPLQGLARNWNGALEGERLNPESTGVAGTEINRSKELSSRMRYKYY